MTDSLHIVISDFLQRIEGYSKRKLLHPGTVSMLLISGFDVHKRLVLEELIFQAKFVVKTREVMERIGPGREGFDKLQQEFEQGVARTSDLLGKLLVGRSIDAHKFLSSDQRSLYTLLELLSDLSWVKNWQVDGKSLPYESSPSTVFAPPGTVNPSRQMVTQKNMYRAIILVAILFLFLLVLDPPSLSFGWGLSVGILLLLSYIIVELFRLNKH